MSHLIANDAMLAVLNQAKDVTEIRDASGKVVGFYAPASSAKSHLLIRAAMRIDPQETERRIAEQGGYTTKEVFEYLKSITEDEPMRSYLQTKIDRLERDSPTEG